MAKKLTQRQYDKLAEKLVKQVQQEVKPFADDSAEAKAERKRKAREDLLYFCKTYLPHYFNETWESGHKYMAEGIKKWNAITHILGFRGLGKTTLIITGYGLQAILFQLTRFLPVVSDTDDQSELLMLPLKVELENNARIQQDFGDMKGVEWENGNFITRNNVKTEAYSWRQFKRGRKYLQWRAKIALLDDMENLESVKNKANIDKREDAVLGDILNALDLKGDWQIVILTNRLGRDDLSQRLKANKKIHTIEIPAEKSNGHAAHPKSFPKKVLNQIKGVIKNVRYNREYLLKVISTENDAFQEKWITWIKKPAEKYKYIVIANDPSVKATQKNDTKAIPVVGITEDLKHFDVLWSYIKHSTIHNMCRTLFKAEQTYHPHAVVLESNGFQVLLKDTIYLLAKDMKEGFDLITKIIQVENRVNKNVRIMRLQSPIENGVIRFVKDSGDNDRLVNQLLEFKEDRSDNEDDGPDALEMAIRKLKSMCGMSQSEVGAEIY